MSFNKEQLEAIAASSNENILISAGAGSGKTKTLSERVFRLISSGEVKP
ncbi:MAG: UvrD-helicase domain-containing protein, partial [Bacilli bacterium]|nr:UvrD-helicase domain-containing protein [Bacilli bacterium]